MATLAQAIADYMRTQAQAVDAAIVCLDSKDYLMVRRILGELRRNVGETVLKLEGSK